MKENKTMKNNHKYHEKCLFLSIFSKKYSSHKYDILTKLCGFSCIKPAAAKYKSRHLVFQFCVCAEEGAFFLSLVSRVVVGDGK